LLFLTLLANLPHGGSPPYGNPIFRSGEVCRHSKINSAQDISPLGAGFVNSHATLTNGQLEQGSRQSRLASRLLPQSQME